MEANSAPSPANKLTKIGELSKSIQNTKVGRRADVRGSVTYLTSHSVDVGQWQDVIEMAVAAYDPVNPDARGKALGHHIEVVRGELARQLWARQVFVGVTVLDQLLFEAVRAGDPDPVLSVVTTLRNSRQDMESLIVFPLQSFGILAAGLLGPMRGQSAFLTNSGRRVSITPQTNDLRRTVDHINAVGPALGVTKPADFDLMQHWYVSRDARWLERNPLIVAGVSSVTGYYYENEFLLLGRLRSLTTAISMLASMQPRAEERAATLFSSARVNSWETRDINHYVLLSSDGGKSLRGRAVPIHQRDKVDDLSELPVDLDPRYWSRYNARASSVYAASESLFNGYLAHSVGLRRETSLGRLYRKLFDAVTYFRRSHRDDWSSVISLATAFEMLLTDHYEAGVTQRLRRRTKNLLVGVRGTQKFQAAVVDLYNARSATVHRGEPAHLDLYAARQAFVLVFLGVMSRLPGLPVNEPRPLAFLTGDA